MTGTLNKVMLIGHTGDDVKVKYFENGGAVGNFPLATNEVYTNKTTGEKVENTEWHNIVVRNKAAEICEKYLKKGDKVYIEGRIKTRKWTDDKGIDRYTTEIQCLDFTFLTPKSSDGAQGGARPAGNQPNAQAQRPAPESSGMGMNDDSDDLPF